MFQRILSGSLPDVLVGDVELVQTDCLSAYKFGSRTASRVLVGGQ
jgi:hypothetical protein